MNGTPGSSPTPDHQSVSILLWNVWLLPGLLTDGRSKQRAHYAACHALLAESERLDVILLNEAFLHKDVLLGALQPHFPHVAALGRQGHRTAFESGLLVLSKLPIMRTQAEVYTQRSGWDAFAAKGILFCRLQLPSGCTTGGERGRGQVAATPQHGDAAGAGGSSGAAHGQEARAGARAGCCLDLYVTHMQAGHNPAAQQARRSQALQAAAFIRRCSGDEGQQAPAPREAPCGGLCGCCSDRGGCGAGLLGSAAAGVPPAPSASAPGGGVASPPAGPGAWRHPILLAGDLNMGPCLDPSFATHSVHYRHPGDARERSSAYGHLKQGAGLADLSDPATPDDINRFLVRPAGGAAAVVRASVAHRPAPLAPAGYPLSDSLQLFCELELRHAPA